MIKLIREVNRNYPWFLATMIGLIALTFIVGMGWVGFEGYQNNNVALIGDQAVTRDEYRRILKNKYEFIQKQKQEIKEEEIQQGVLNDLITARVWKLAAQDMGLEVSSSELRADIIKTPAFQKDGKFDPQHYRQILKINNLNPTLYENGQSEQLLVQKAMMLVVESVSLTPGEIAEAEGLLGGQPAGASDSSISKDMIVKSFLFQKQQRALAAYTESLKGTVPIEIFKENL